MGEGGREEVGRAEGGETVIRIYCIRQEPIFQYMGEEGRVKYLPRYSLTNVERTPKSRVR